MPPYQRVLCTKIGRVDGVTPSGSRLTMPTGAPVARARASRCARSPAESSRSTVCVLSNRTGDAKRRPSGYRCVTVPDRRSVSSRCIVSPRTSSTSRRAIMMPRSKRVSCTSACSVRSNTVDSRRIVTCPLSRTMRSERPSMIVSPITRLYRRPSTSRVSRRVRTLKCTGVRLLRDRSAPRYAGNTLRLRSTGSKSKRSVDPGDGNTALGIGRNPGIESVAPSRPPMRSESSGIGMPSPYFHAAVESR